MEALFGQLHDEGVPRHTSDYVLDELLSLLFRRVDHEGATRFVEGILESAHRGHLKIHRVTAERFREAWVLRKRYQDKPLISFTDLTSFVLIIRSSSFPGFSRMMAISSTSIWMSSSFLARPHAGDGPRFSVGESGAR